MAMTFRFDVNRAKKEIVKGVLQYAEEDFNKSKWNDFADIPINYGMNVLKTWHNWWNVEAGHTWQDGFGDPGNYNIGLKIKTDKYIVNVFNTSPHAIPLEFGHINYRGGGFVPGYYPLTRGLEELLKQKLYAPFVE